MMNEEHKYPTPTPITNNREQVDRDIHRYIKRNTPRKGENKGIPPLQSDLIDYTVELIWRVAVETCLLFDEDSRISFDDVVRGLQEGAVKLFIDRMDELRELGITVKVADEGETSG